jgi:hypothetical protein
MNNCGKIALLALGALVAQPAQASDKQDFAACDGLKHPGKRDDGMRGEASRPGFSFNFFGESTPPAGPVIAACTRALESPRLLPSQGLRRAHLLRARAIAYLETNEPAKALADLDLAESAVGSLRDEPFFSRSMGASMQLLRALAKAQAGEPDVAQALARQAAEARPYALAVQFVAASVVHNARPIGTPSPSPWTTLARLEPDAALNVLNREAEVGNFAAVLALGPSVELTWPDRAPTSFPLLAAKQQLNDLASTLMASFNIAYAHAVAGDAERARAELAEVQANLARLRAPGPDSQVATADSAADLFDRLATQAGKQIEARIAVAEGRRADAIAALVGTSMPTNAASVELFEALRASAPAGETVTTPDPGPLRTSLEARRGREFARLAPLAVIAPESPRAVIDYERARPNLFGELVGAAFTMGATLLDGVSRTDGFRSTANPDGTVKVEFIGNTPSAPMVQEMTLLRAAELAKAAGKAGFVIVERNDYTRTLQMSRGGIPVSSTPQGFKTELTVRFVDPGAEPQRAFDAIAVIDALGPLYYEAAEPRLAAR